jgi:hypothetical protein
MMKRILISSFVLFCMVFAGCKVNYSLSGINLGDAKTVSVSYFQSNAPLAKPSYANTLTESLKDMLMTQTPLSLLSSGADLQYEGAVTDYSVSPVAIQSGVDRAALNRLTITISVKYTNNRDPGKSAEFSVSKYTDYPSSQNLSSTEDALIKTINDQILQEIFNKTLTNW